MGGVIEEEVLCVRCLREESNRQVAMRGSSTKDTNLKVISTLTGGS